MNKLTELLQSPYPALCQRWKTVVMPSFIVFLILLLLQPFGMAQMHGEHKLLIVVGYGLVTAVALSISAYVLPALFASYYKEEGWTGRKYLLNSLMSCLLVATGNWFYTSWVYHLHLDWSLFGISLLWVVLITPFPVVIFAIWNRNLILIRHLKEANEINTSLSKKLLPKDEHTSLATLLFVGGTKEVLEIEASNFRYAEVDGNYIRVTYLSSKEERVTHKLLRAIMNAKDVKFELFTKQNR